MTDQTRAKKGRRKRRSASQLFLAALVVFGIVASVLLLFSESVQWMRVGVLSALWAAVIGAFAMTKYRREAAADQTKAKDLQTVYELQLAREISARREYEMSVEARVRNETRLESDEVAALRNELAALRQNLQVLFEGNLPTERVALRAEAMRMQELGGRGYDSYQPAPSGLYVRGGGNGNGPAGPGFNGVGTPYDEPVTAETSVVYPEDPDEMPRATAAPDTDSRYAQDASAEQGSAPEGSDDVTDAGQNDRTEPPAAQSRPYGAPRPAGRVSPPTSPFTAYNFEQTRRPAAESEPVEDAEPVEEAQPQQATESESAEEEATYPESRRSLRDSADAFFAADRVDDTPAEETADAPRRGRRRAESTEEASGAHSNGRSVAEIMAGLAGGDSADTTTTDAGTRRRRRRAD
ncbi:DUF6779 domain-containing protein [Rhodococcoides fascians]|jgi:hypothetical protein|uniref:DUF6779 domain-containing protein n=1 Tax=Nocardiaceae TaxID=85025 RepID=UPI0005F7C317|nr:MULTISPECIES: DUF6779 domain-containing protein [Rhodococcus]KJV02386.1 hypothetical protein VF34_02200 [Rhodococcus sp. PML026]WQH29188.1 DUF6779 domain-containing protein [Rhodococcus fascians]